MAARSTSPSREAIERYEARILAYEHRAQASPRSSRRAPTSGLRRRAPRRVPANVRARRIVVLAALMLLLDLFSSFALAMMQPSNSPFGVRAVEWLRDNGAAWLVSDVESIYYSLNAPSTGGPPLKGLPKVGSTAGTRVASNAPPPIAPVINPPLPGEGAMARNRPVGRRARSPAR